MVAPDEQRDHALVFTSYCDVNYFPRFAALAQSVQKFETDSRFYLLCLDPETFDLAHQLISRGVTPLRLEDLEDVFPELLNVKRERTFMEYVFTLTPYLMKFTSLKSGEGDLVFYLDADLWFFSDPKTVTNELNDFEVGIIPHAYPENLANGLKKYGTFNVGLVAVRNSDVGRSCLSWWASQCLEWCGDEPVDGKYADQGYLDQFPNLFDGVKVLENRGFNLAPWNTMGQVILTDSDGRVTLGDQTPLTFFHFHGLKRFGKWMVTSQLNYRSPATKSLIEFVYKPYLRALQTAEKELENTKSGRPTQKLVRGKGVRKWARNLLGKLLMIASVLTGNAVDMSRLK